MRNRNNGFISYAHADIQRINFLEKLKVHLRPLIREGELDIWDDTRIKPGDDWRREIEQALQSASFAILLVGPYFIASDFIAQHELTSLLEAAQKEGLLVLPLSVGTCFLPPELTCFQFVNDPQKPLADMRPNDRDKIYLKLIECINEHLSSNVSVRNPLIEAQAAFTNTLAIAPQQIAGSNTTCDFMMESLVQRGQKLVQGLSREIENQVEAIRDAYRRGGYRKALDEIGALMRHACWDDFPPNLKGRILRIAATYILQSERNIEQASQLVQKARAIDPQGDNTILDAQFAYTAGDQEQAITLLHNRGNTLDAFHFKAVIELNAGQLDAVFVSLHSLPPDLCPNAETYRLRALAWLTKRDLPNALDAIEQAYALAPEWCSVLETRAVVNFWRACTPAALQITSHPLAPSPFSRGLVRADDTAKTYLLKSSQEFARLAQQEGTPDPEVQRYRTWQFLCLLASGECLEEVRPLLQRLLDSDPTDLWVLSWAAVYEIEFDRPKVKAALAAVPKENKNFPNYRGLYYALTLEEGGSEEVLEDLERTRILYESHDQLHAWYHWRIQALLTLERLDEARSEVRALNDPGLESALTTQIAIWEASDPHNPRRLTAAEEIYCQRGDPLSLLAACRAHARNRNWSFVVDHKEELLATIPTPEVVSLVAQAQWHRGHYPECLELLDCHRSVFPAGHLPLDLDALRVRCQRALGQLNEAIEAARANFEAHPESYALLELIDVQAQQGDLNGIVASAQRLLGMGDIPGDTFLHVAEIVRLVDRNLAVTLWHKASAVGSDEPEFPIQAYLTGQALGLGDEVAPHFKRAIELAEQGKGGLFLVEFAEAIEQIRQWHEQTNRQIQLYEQGTVPVHVVPEGTRRPLSILFHQIPQQNRENPDPLLQAPVLARHGSRSIQHLSRRQRLDGRLYVDITGLLIAADLEILDRVERVCSPLYIPLHVQAYLIEELRKLRPHNLEELQARQEVKKIIRAGGIQLVGINAKSANVDQGLVQLTGEHNAAKFHYVKEAGGLFVEFLPLRSPDLNLEPVVLPTPWNREVISPRAVAKALSDIGRIDEAQYKRATTLLQENGEEPVVTPQDHQVLLLSPTIAVLFQQCGLLQVLTINFKLKVPADEWRQYEDELQRWETEDRLADWLQQLIDRIQKGLAGGTYQTLSAVKSTPGASENPNAFWLTDLLQLDGKPGDWIWVDDRYMNAYQRSGQCALVSTVEILDLLRATGNLTEQEYYRLINKLRAGNYRYIPLEKNEILYWLSQASIQTDKLVELPELKILRQYWAACLHRGSVLQRPPEGATRRGELDFIVTSRLAISEAIAAVWSDSRLGFRRKSRRAQWILDHLYTSFINLNHLVPDQAIERRPDIPGMEIASLLMICFKLDSKKSADGRTKESVLTLCSNWLNKHIIEPRLKADPQAAVTAASILKDTLSVWLDAATAKSEQAVRMLESLVFFFLRALPKTVREEIHRDSTLMDRLGLTSVKIINITDQPKYQFDVTAFWGSIAQALMDKTERIKTVDGLELTVRATESSPESLPQIEWVSVKGKVKVRSYIEFSDMLFPLKQQRLSALRRHPEWWDGEDRNLEAIEQEFASIDIPAERIAALERMKERSAAACYKNAENNLYQTGNISLNDLQPPALAAILRYVRLDGALTATEVTIDSLWQVAGYALLATLNLDETILRATCLPLPVPIALRSAIEKQNAQELKELFQRIQPRLAGPLSRLHLIDLALTGSSAWPGAFALAEENIEYLLSERATEEFALLKDMATFAGYHLANQPEHDHFPGSMRLLAAWIHAARISQILLRDPGNTADLARWLRERMPTRVFEFYKPAGQIDQDLLWPANVVPADLLFHSLGRILSHHPSAIANLKGINTVHQRIEAILVGKPMQSADLTLLRNPLYHTDRLSCLWGGSREDALMPLAPLEIAARFSPVNISQSVDHCLDEVTQDPLNESTWFLLSTFVGTGRLPAEQAARLESIFGRLDLDIFLEHSPAILIDCLNLTIPYLTQTERIQATLSQWAAGIDNRSYPPASYQSIAPENTTEHFMNQLINWSYLLANREQSPSAADQVFAQLMEVLLTRSRRVAELLRQPLNVLSRRLAFEQHRALHRLVLVAQSRPSPS